MYKYLTDLEFKYPIVDSFPGLSDYKIVPRKTPGVAYAMCNPTHTLKPSLLAWSTDLFEKLNVNQNICDSDHYCPK
jgi:hypothetical protein